MADVSETSKPHSVLDMARGYAVADSPSHINVLACEVVRLFEQFDAAMDCMNYAWTIICNVSEGDWTKQRQEWQDAAARCRDQYHALLASNPAKRPPTPDTAEFWGGTFGGTAPSPAKERP